MRKFVVTAYLVMLATLFGCGGGGGGGGSNSTPSIVAIATCPNGDPVPATGIKDCKTVAVATSFTLGSIEPRAYNGEITIPPTAFTGKIDPSSTVVTLWLGAVNTGTVVAEKASFAADGTITESSVQWLAYGQSYTIAIDGKDSVGRTVHLEFPFTTHAMVCADNITWSNPANFSPVYQDCVADIGIQTQINPLYNTLQDNTCIVTIGSPLTAACKAYMANATMVLSNTSIVVNGHSVMWDVYLGTDGTSNAVLLDINDPTTPVPVAIYVSPVPILFVWDIGNPTGIFIHTIDGKGSQLTVDSGSNIVSTCILGC